MKKLFFTALVAVVAIGGAYAQYSETPFGPDTFNCIGDETPLCSESSPIYEAGTNNVITDPLILDQTKVDHD